MRKNPLLSVLMALFLLAPAAGPARASSEMLFPNREKNIAEHLLDRIVRAYDLEDPETFLSTLSKLSPLDRAALKARLNETFTGFKHIHIRLVVDRTTHENHQVAFDTHWQKTMTDVPTGKLVLSEGKARITFDVLMRPELLNIEGNSPF